MTFPLEYKNLEITTGLLTLKVMYLVSEKGFNQIKRHELSMLNELKKASRKQ